MLNFVAQFVISCKDFLSFFKIPVNDAKVVRNRDEKLLIGRRDLARRRSYQVAEEDLEYATILQGTRIFFFFFNFFL